MAEKGDPKYIFTIPRAILHQSSLCDKITATKSVMKSLQQNRWFAVSLFAVSLSRSVDLARKYRGGGVAFYIRDDIEYTHRIDLDLMNEKIFESIFADIKFQDKVITCGNIYRSPCNNGNVQKMFLADVDDIMRKINKRESFLLGDFNYNILNCDKPNVTKFIDVMYDHGFSSLIYRPTRITDNSSTLLDQI